MCKRWIVYHGSELDDEGTSELDAHSKPSGKVELHL